MNLQIALVVVEALLRYGPGLAREIVSIFSKETITAADWEKVFAAAEKSYDDYVKAKDMTSQDGRHT